MAITVVTGGPIDTDAPALSIDVTTGGPITAVPPNLPGISYSTLQTSIANWSQRTDISADEIRSLIALAEAMLNYGQQDMEPLRVRDMLNVLTMTPESGECLLPGDYLSYRTVVELSTPRRPLSYITPGHADQIYPSRPSGAACDFTIVGDTLTTFPATSNDIDLTYYQAIPPLTDINTTNWLLTKQPNLYLHASLLQLAMYVRDDNLFQRSAALVKTLVDGLNTYDVLGNYAMAGTRLGMLTP
jgi:hypothetical protein